MERFCHQKEMYEKMYENLLVTSIGESARMQSPSLGTIKKIRLGDTDSDTGSVSCIMFCFRYDTVSGRPSRIQPLK